MEKQLLSHISDLRKNDPDYSYIKKKIRFSFKKDLERFIYYYNAWKITESNKHNIIDIDKRSWDFHLDHIIPISIGFKYNINPNIIGNICNLRILPSMENRSKSAQITDDTIRVLSDFGIDLQNLPLYDRDIISVNKPIVLNEPDLIIDNPRSLLYYE